MGTFVTTVRAVGNHGCQREKKDGELVIGCGQAGCTDCITREYVAKLRSIGTSIVEARVHHWPDGDKQIVDNLLTAKRLGSF